MKASSVKVVFEINEQSFVDLRARIGRMGDYVEMMLPMWRADDEADREGEEWKDGGEF